MRRGLIVIVSLIFPAATFAYALPWVDLQRALARPPASEPALPPLGPWDLVVGTLDVAQGGASAQVPVTFVNRDILKRRMFYAGADCMLLDSAKQMVARGYANAIDLPFGQSIHETATMTIPADSRWDVKTVICQPLANL